MENLKNRNWTFDLAVKKLSEADYACQAGNMKDDEAFLHLKDRAKYSPKFYIGQHVQHFIQINSDLGTGGDWFDCVVVGCRLVMGQYKVAHCYDLAKGTFPKPQEVSVDIGDVSQGKIRAIKT